MTVRTSSRPTGYPYNVSAIARRNQPVTPAATAIAMGTTSQTITVHRHADLSLDLGPAIFLGRCGRAANSGRAAAVYRCHLFDPSAGSRRVRSPWRNHAMDRQADVDPDSVVRCRLHLSPAPTGLLGSPSSNSWSKPDGTSPPCTGPPPTSPTCNGFQQRGWWRRLKTMAGCGLRCRKASTSCSMLPGT